MGYLYVIIPIGLVLTACTDVVDSEIPRQEPLVSAMTAAIIHLTAPGVGVHLVSGDESQDLAAAEAEAVATALNLASSRDWASFSHDSSDELPPVVQCREAAGADPCRWVGPGEGSGEVYHLFRSSFGEDDGRLLVSRVLVGEDYERIQTETWSITFVLEEEQWVVREAKLVGGTG